LKPTRSMRVLCQVWHSACFVFNWFHSLLLCCNFTDIMEKLGVFCDIFLKYLNWEIGNRNFMSSIIK
jgi:hypothetical protein